MHSAGPTRTTVRELAPIRSASLNRTTRSRISLPLAVPAVPLSFKSFVLGHEDTWLNLKVLAGAAGQLNGHSESATKRASLRQPRVGVQPELRHWHSGRAPYLCHCQSLWRQAAQVFATRAGSPASERRPEKSPQGAAGALDLAAHHLPPQRRRSAAMMSAGLAAVQADPHRRAV